METFDDVRRHSSVVLGDFLEVLDDRDENHKYLEIFKDADGPEEFKEEMDVNSGSFGSALLDDDFGSAFREGDFDNIQVLYFVLNRWSRYATISEYHSGDGYTDRTVPAHEVERVEKKFKL